MLKNIFRKELLDEEFSHAIELFNNSSFYDSYNLLFELWHNSISPNRKLLYQGLIQSCAALHLLEKGKFCGARKVVKSAIKNLLPFEVIKKPFNIKKLIADLYEYFENLDMLDHDSLDPNMMDIKIIARPKIVSSL